MKSSYPDSRLLKRAIVETDRSSASAPAPNVTENAPSAYITEFVRLSEIAF